MDRFSEFVRDRKLVSIRRERIDPNSLQGFILGYSDELLLMQNVYDFRLDGLRVVRSNDITDIKCNTTDELQKELLIAEGLVQKVPFGSAFDLRDWRAIITQLSRECGFMILENEDPESETFLIGEVEKITRSSVWLRYFSGAGEWDEKPTKLPFGSITSCQVDTNYINVYRRHFARMAS